MARKTVTEQEKKTMRAARMEPGEPIGDADAMMVAADKTLETNGTRSLELEEIIRQARMVKGGETALDGEMLVLGRNYVVFTPAITLVGRLIELSAWEMRLADASWVADTGRFHQAFAQGFSREINSEVEPCGEPIVVARGAMLYAVPYKHALPKEAI